MITTMRSGPISRLAVAALGIALVFTAVPAAANNPILVTSTGTPYKWNSFPITYTVDGGNLGALTNAEANALTAQAFGTWTSVPTASLSVTQNSVIGLADGDVNTVAEYDSVTSLSSCLSANPIIYDTDGAITDGLFGAGASNSILGFAGPCAINAAGAIGGLEATLNGKFVSGSPVSALARSQMLGVLIHELGHALGLGHSQVNLNCLTSAASCPSNAAGGDIFGVPTMFPIALSRTESTDVNFLTTLAADDISAISTLYPRQPDFGNSTGTISGIVFFGDGVNHFQGANVIARRVLMSDGITPGDPRVTAVSNVSGMFAQVDHGNAALDRPPSARGSANLTKRGEYTIPGLPPGTYTVEVESVRSSFIGGSNVGPVSDERDENIPLPAAAEFFGGPESNTDNPAVAQTLLVGPGNVLTSNNVVLNDTLATMDAFDTAARNETIATATPLAAGTTTASISANNGPDVDVYAINVPAGQVLTVETRSRRRVPQAYLDSVIELMDATAARLTNCRIGNDSTLYDHGCLDDDFTSGALTLDSKLTYAGPPGTVYLHVSDALGDFRPDFIYDVNVSLATAQPELLLPASPADFGLRYVNSADAPLSITVRNIGAADLVLGPSPFAVTNINNGGVFSLGTNFTCADGLVLPPGESCIVNVNFLPSGAGFLYTGRLSVVSNAVGSPISLDLRGSGVDFFIISVPSSKTIPAGQGTSVTIGLAPTLLNGLPAATTFAVSNLPPGANTSFTPVSLPANTPNGPNSSTLLTISTTARAAVIVPTSPQPFVLLLVFPIVTTFLVTLIIIRYETPAPGWIRVCTLLGLVCVFASVGACGGGGAGGSGGSPSNPVATPAGTYPLTITATSGPRSHTTTLTLIVQ